MFEKNWETRWEKYTFDFAGKINEIKKDASFHLWFYDFLQSSVVLTNILFPSVITFLKEFKLKISSFDEKNFDKKLGKFKRTEVEHIIKIFLMDYFTTCLDNPYNKELFEQKGIDSLQLDQLMKTLLFFTKDEQVLYKEMKEKKETYYPSILLLEKFHTGKDAKNEALLEGIELIKETVYNKMDITLHKLMQE